MVGPEHPDAGPGRDSPAPPKVLEGRRIPPGVTGGIAAYKSASLVMLLAAAGPLAAGDEGAGRMAEPEEIFQSVVAAWGGGGQTDLAGRAVLVTAGPTHEPLDAVRYVGNRSSGKMGFAVAEEAARRGARVTIV